MKFISGLSIALAMLFFNHTALADGDPVNGKQLYQAMCFKCHSIDDNEMGPRHRGVFNRLAGSVQDYEYSKAVKNSGIVWTAENLNKWLTNPQALIPGQQMNFSVPSEQNRADLIAYLKTQVDAGQPVAAKDANGED